MGKTLIMYKVGKYDLKPFIKISKYIEKWLSEKGNNVDDVYEDFEVIQNLHDFVGNLEVGNYDDVDFFIAAFYENYKSCGGDWDKLGSSITPITPKKQRWFIEQKHRQESIVYEEGSIDSYMPSMVKWDAYEGNIDFDIIEEDVRDSWDYEFGDIHT